VHEDLGRAGAPDGIMALRRLRHVERHLQDARPVKTARETGALRLLVLKLPHEA
jgi:hypothetical protein